MTYYSMTPGSKSDCCQTDLQFDPDSQHDLLHGKVADPWFDGHEYFPGHSAMLFLL